LAPYHKKRGVLNFPALLEDRRCRRSQQLEKGPLNLAYTTSNPCSIFKVRFSLVHLPSPSYNIETFRFLEVVYLLFHEHIQQTLGLLGFIY
jgi:hypothetical protein